MTKLEADSDGYREGVRFIYFGTRPDGPGSGVVSVAPFDAKTGIGREEALPPCNEIRNHSPDGFEWGYGGSGPAQLALALCVHALTHEGKPWPKQRAERVYQIVKDRVIARQQSAMWMLNDRDVIDAIEQAEKIRGPLPLYTCDEHADQSQPFEVMCPECEKLLTALENAAKQ